MANPYQQQVFQRKLGYLGLMVALLVASFLFRRNVVEAKARDLGLLEESHGDVEVLGYAARTGLSGLRGFVTCGLWVEAIEQQKKNQWNQLERTVRQVTRLQPHLITPWLFQSWNLAYNVSVESDRVNDKYFYISRGIQLLAQGERQNRLQPDLRRELGFYNQHKLGQSDENNTVRSLFQLSCIPPVERDPDQFRTADGGINLDKLQKFCESHPQLARRLHSPPLPYDLRKEHPKFRCATARELVQFLEDNKNVPSLFVSKLESKQDWEQGKTRENPLDRFPVLPPHRSGLTFDPNPVTADSLIAAAVPDEFDPFAVARAWYGYAQECLPPPGDLPGSTKPIVDRSLHRMNRYMATVIFRSLPSRAQSFMADRLQDEGWYDEEQFPIDGWFGTPSAPYRLVRIGFARSWSAEAWRRSRDSWRRFGRENHLLFEPESERFNMQKKADQFVKEMSFDAQGPPPRFDPENLDDRQKELLHAFRFMREFNSGRTLTNFAHMLMRSGVEMQPRTVKSRKLFYQAERLRLVAQSPAAAREKYEHPDALLGWRVILEENPEFRDDPLIQEQTFEMDLKYTRSYRRRTQDKLAPDLALLAALGQAVGGTPLGPDWAMLGLFSRPQLQPDFVVVGPLEKDSEGKPLVPDQVKDDVLVRRGLKKGPGGPPPMDRPAEGPREK